MFLRQSTAQTIRFGPFLDATDGSTVEDSLTIAQADRQISKDGAAFAQTSDTNNATHDTDGWYSCSITATDTDTCGELLIQVNVTGALPVWVRYYVIEEAIYDDLFAASSTGYATPTEVNTEVSDVLKTDTVTLPGQTAPPASPTFEQMVAWLYKTFRNKKTQTAGTWSLYDDAGTTVDAKATVSDNGTTATKEEVVSGP